MTETSEGRLRAFSVSSVAPPADLHAPGFPLGYRPLLTYANATSPAPRLRAPDVQTPCTNPRGACTDCSPDRSAGALLTCSETATPPGQASGRLEGLVLHGRVSQSVNRALGTGLARHQQTAAGGLMDARPGRSAWHRGLPSSTAPATVAHSGHQKNRSIWTGRDWQTDNRGIIILVRFKLAALARGKACFLGPTLFRDKVMYSDNTRA
ncbi:hypothetical protein NDU88_007192 [Pleurodeles waltl]|uniref:Uncharacterized protein n=1 Tax=Pleurodeles waltl TaxID=8319 RepID=A0AAV7LZ50_PLEWA|nr:hypothetical protein NDU88_007192 [Pleurodeles waltl]